MKTLSFFTSSCLALTCLFSTTAQAANPSFGSPAIAGSGCSAGSLSYKTYSLNKGRTFSIRTKSFRAKPGNMSCNIALPVQVPNGYRVTEVRTSYTGYVKGQAALHRSYFLAGSTGTSLVSSLSSTSGQAFSRQDHALLKAACGEDVNVRLNSRIRTKTNTSNIGISNIRFSVYYAKCSR